LILFFSFILILTFITLSGIHIYWALGGKWGASVAIPSIEGNKKVFEPGPFATLIVAFGLFFFAAIVYFNAFETGIMSNWVLNIILTKGLWLIMIVFLLRAIGEFKYVGFFKKVKDTSFGKADAQLFTPLCLGISLISLILIIIKS
jgi:hypothetical protein